MARKYWIVAVPVLLLFGAGARAFLDPLTTRGSDGRIASPQLEAMEARVGYHLYAPTWLPPGGRVGTIGVLEGAHRVLQDFSDAEDRSILIISQERRTPDRDRYHERVFEKKADARADVNGRTGYFVTGASGERRLFWNFDASAIIVSSASLTDQQLLKIARKVR